MTETLEAPESVLDADALAAVPKSQHQESLVARAAKEVEEITTKGLSTEDRQRALHSVMSRLAHEIGAAPTGAAKKSSEEERLLGEAAAEFADTSMPHYSQRLLRKFQQAVRGLTRGDTTGSRTAALFHRLRRVVEASGSKSVKRGTPARAMAPWDYKLWDGPAAVCGLSDKERVKIQA